MNSNREIWMQRLSTWDWGQPASSFCSSYCTWTVTYLCTNWQVSVCTVSFSVEFNFTAPYFDLYLYSSAYKENKLWTVLKIYIYIVLKFAVVCYEIFLLLAVLKSHLWKASCLFGVLKDAESLGHLPFCVCLNCGPSTRSACIKVCFFRYCSLFAKVDPAFKLNTWILGLMFWTGLCINWNGLVRLVRLLFWLKHIRRL